MSTEAKSREHAELIAKICTLEKQLETVNLQLASYQNMTIRHLQIKRQMAFQLHKQEWDKEQLNNICRQCGSFIVSSTDQTDCSMDITNPTENDNDEID